MSWGDRNGRKENGERREGVGDKKGREGVGDEKGRGWKYEKGGKGGKVGGRNKPIKQRRRKGKRE